MLESAVAQYKASQRLQTRTVLQARRAWAQVQAGLISESWEIILRNSGLVATVSAAQFANASSGASYSAGVLADQGEYVAPEAFVNPAGFAGVSADGRSLEGLLYSTAPYVKNLIKSGHSPVSALASGRGHLDMLVKTAVADAGRGAASVDIATRPGTGYIRALNPPSCSRCSVLAGKFYRWNAGFRRHPGCDCVHQAATDKALRAGKLEGLIHDPYEYFNSLSEAEQNRVYTNAGAQAIRDGADLFQVVNSRRGMTYAGVSKDGTVRGQLVKSSFTSEGTTRRGNFGKSRRLTPEAIYRLNGDNRKAALADLEKYGYVLPGGQNPLGSIRGQREGFGALGRGGERKAASDAVRLARETGVRDGSRYTMTEAERRLFDAKRRWELVQQGINPYASPGFGNTPDPFGRGLNNIGGGDQPLTPKIAAQVEKDYRRWLYSNGQIF
ncbi:hypothetical protein ACLQ8T_05770 [Glutamicibacter sp. FR1]|uniref:hypothetical protein n=1 Tax=Glutamicibacter sp. FR1 TaxID=3393744 RepID=UPI0039AF25E5